jgi:hypothetical protein
MIARQLRLILLLRSDDLKASVAALLPSVNIDGDSPAAAI